MGVCCSKDKMFEGFQAEDDEEYIEEEGTCRGDCGALVRLKGSCKYASMYSQQGKKGVNQDAMTLWKDFTGESDMVFCGVFDGHGPSGHKVASHIRDVLPSKISSELKSSKPNSQYDLVSEVEDRDSSSQDSDGQSSPDKAENDQSPISSWKSSILKAFEDVDEELSVDSTVDSYSSGSTAVAVLKKEDHLMIANLGDSRAILCVRNKKNQPVPVQLTVDLKPNVPCEAERIKSCNGRVFAMDEEPDVYRLWLPEDNSPGLAMARAFGDFCLKDYGLISTPKLSYRKITNRDEFVVIATDGVWDVLSNQEVVKIVASVRKRSMAAKVLVQHAVRAWKMKYPCSKIDDCAVVCLFLKPLAAIPKSKSCKEGSTNRSTRSDSYKSVRSGGSHDDNHDFLRSRSTASHNTGMSDEEWNALEGVSRVNTVLKLPRFSSDASQRKRGQINAEGNSFASP